jgi:acyl-CoA thioester hydrolase
MSDVFSVRIGVRGYELDSLGHVNQAEYLRYAEHARWEFLRLAGVGVDTLAAAGIAPVALENTIRYRRELRAGDEVDVTCAFVLGRGRTFQIDQEMRRTDGVLAAEFTATGGIMDLKERRLLSDPIDRLRALATHPEALGL